MKIGVFIFATDYTIATDELARELEQRGFEALFVPEHTHIPASRESAWPGGADLPKDYWHTYDPFVALSFAAAVTTKLTLGTGILLLPQREPIVTANAVASLDRMSGGRFILGLGGGWNVEEMENHGAQYQTRFALLRERVLAMKEIWTQENAEYHGDHVDFAPMWSHPKPVQTPHPPILLGGETDHTLRRVVEYCDGWLPRGRGGFDPAVAMARLTKMALEADRDPAELTISVFGAPAEAEAMDAYREAGITRALLTLPSEPRDDVLKRLDGYGELLG